MNNDTNTNVELICTNIRTSTNTIRTQMQILVETAVSMKANTLNNEYIYIDTVHPSTIHQMETLLTMTFADLWRGAWIIRMISESF